ncbi:MAG: conjugal transfer protein TraE [Chromatiaceae bacterium]|nr:MAG: conjugal transfer protein TraE [Chromatiaceae bacterium]
MKWNEYLDTWQGQRLEIRFARIIIVLLLLALTALALSIGQIERTVVLVPPILEGEVTVAHNRASREVHEAWGLHIANLLGNVSPVTVDMLTQVLDPLFAPALRARLYQNLITQAEEIKRENARMRFEPRMISFDEATQTVYVSGMHQTQGPGRGLEAAPRTYEMRIRFRNYRPQIVHLDAYRGDPKAPTPE